MKFLFVFFFATIFEHVSYCKMQRYSVKGILRCGTSPMANTQVKLVDIGNLLQRLLYNLCSGSIHLIADQPGWDDVMDESYSDEDGNFFLDGQTKEITPIDPVLKIYHDCSDGLPCNRRWKVALPKSFISEPGENIVNKTYDVGIFNLEIRWKKEKRRCEILSWT